MGDDIRDWVWTAMGRVKVQDFINKVFDALGDSYKAKLCGVRLGGGPFGELMFPKPGSEPYAWWGFGLAPQSGADLAEDQSVAPRLAPGTNQGAEKRWIEWFHDSLNTFLLWLIEVHRDNWNGDIFVLHPSFGIRDDWPLDSDTYYLSAAEGQDWRRYLSSYASQPKVYPWCTWADRLDYDSPPVLDSEKAPFRKLWELATEQQRTGIGGENTGTYNTNLFDSNGAMALGYQNIMWITWNSLVVPIVKETLEEQL